MRGHRDRAPSHLLEVTGFDAVAIYRLAYPSGASTWSPSAACPAHRPGSRYPLGRAAVGPGRAGADLDFDPAASDLLGHALEAAGLHAVAALPLRAAGQARGLMLCPVPRPAGLRPPGAGDPELLQAAADLVAGALEAELLVAALEDTNRVLGALSRMGGALLRPGATRQEVLEAIVRQLTDAQIPEFDFQVAEEARAGNQLQAGRPVSFRRG